MPITAIAKKFAFYPLVLILFCGCTQKSELKEAQIYARQSEAAYQRAVKIEQDLIARGKDLDRLYFDLGKLYYDHGEFDKATEAFKKTPLAQAQELLAVSYYRTGDFTDALGIFNKQEVRQDEALYYYGLTCEKLNLFDKALDIYKKIKAPQFFPLAAERIKNIERQINLKNIKDIDPEVARLIAGSPGQKEYPQAGALVLSCDEKVEITAQNTQISSLHYVVKILNERGKSDFSETDLDYDSTYEKIELGFARTIRPDGKVVEVTSPNIRDVSKYLNFPLYSNARIFIISFPEITEGAVVEYKIRISRSQLINKKDFVFSYPLQAQEPIITASFSVTFPETRNFNIKNINDNYNGFKADLKPIIQENAKERIYSWQFKDIPQIVPESNMPPGVEINPAMLISTFRSWKEVYDWWWQLARDKIKADAAIKEKVKGLTAGMRSEEAKARAIYNFCAQKIRYVAVEYGQAGYEPHKAEDIFRNKYGDCKDQAILLVTMLKEAGLTAWPVLIPTKECYNLDEDFPAVLFNHCIAALSLRNDVIFLDPTAETCSRQ